MKLMKKALTLAILVSAALQLGGCAASYQARSVDLKSTLVNPDILKKGADDQALYRYMNPQFKARNYTKVMIDPVLIRKDGELGKDDLENYQKLANNAFVYLKQELQKGNEIVNAPEPGTMRVQMAITDADSSKPVRNTLATVFPIGMAVSLVKLSATGKQTGVGEITGELKVTDAVTGELLAAALDRRVGGHELSTLWSTWANADASLKFWAQKLSYAFCMDRGGTNCVKPE